MNKEQFYASVRITLFGGGLRQGVVDTLEAIFTACAEHRITDYKQMAYIFATAKHESYHPTLNPTWEPVREGFSKTNAGAIKAVTALYDAKKIRINYAKPSPNGHSYYGRGYVQITWDYNYKTAAKRLSVDLYNNPDLALKRDVAADILVLGMRDGWFTGKKLLSYDVNSPTYFLNCRRIINGTDQAQRIANMAELFYGALSLK